MQLFLKKERKNCPPKWPITAQLYCYIKAALHQSASTFKKDEGPKSWASRCPKVTPAQRVNADVMSRCCSLWRHPQDKPCIAKLWLVTRCPQQVGAGAPSAGVDAALQLHLQFGACFYKFESVQLFSKSSCCVAPTWVNQTDAERWVRGTKRALPKRVRCLSCKTAAVVFVPDENKGAFFQHSEVWVISQWWNWC